MLGVRKGGIVILVRNSDSIYAGNDFAVGIVSPTPLPPLGNDVTANSLIITCYATNGPLTFAC